jgi:predicted RNA polymerase sigma factor
VRGELLSRMGKDAEAADEFDRAASLVTNKQQRRVLAEKSERAR